MRKVFKVIIGGKEYDVFDIEGKEHQSYNGEPKTWWLYYDDEISSDLLPSPDSESFVPYSNSINRRLWDIRFTQNNYSKYKWDEHSFRNNTKCEMYCNGKLIYSFGSTGTENGFSFAMSKAQYLQTVLSEHCYNFFEPETEEGRKIWWKGLPAKIKNSSYPGEIHIRPDYSTGLTKEQWWSELKRREEKLTKVNGIYGDEDDDEMDAEQFQEDYSSDYINWGDALNDKHIDWFRN